MFIFAEYIAYMFIGTIKGGNTLEEVATAVRVISIALLIVPQLSVLRGYLQGHKMITPTSISSVLEQIIRVTIIIFGSYMSVKIFNLPINCAVYIAILAATLSALGAYIYLKIKIRKNKNELNVEDDKNVKYSRKTMLKKIVLYALPFVVIDFIKSLYGIVDSVTVVKTMVNLGYSAELAETAFGVIATWGTKLNMIIISVSMGMTISLVPNIASAFIKKKNDEVNKRINQALSLIIFTTLPMAFGISFLAKPVWVVFYGYNAISIDIFRIFIIQVIFYGLYTIIINISQTMNNTKLSLSALVISFLLKAGLNIPIMYLLKNIGMEAYYGPTITNAIVESITFIVVLLILKAKYKFNYKNVFNVIIKSLFSVAIMMIVLMLISLIFKISSITRFMSIIYIIIYTIIGAIVYFFIAFKTGLLKQVLGTNNIFQFIRNIKS